MIESMVEKTLKKEKAIQKRSTQTGVVEKEA